MRTTEIFRSNDGEEAWFQINGSLITRFGIERVLRRIPGISITKSQYSWRLSREEDFAHFTLDGGQFVVYEPYNDSDLYRIVAEDRAAVEAIGRVQEHFQHHKLFGII